MTFREYSLDYFRKYREKNRERINANAREWRKAHPRNVKQAQERYNAKNPDRSKLRYIKEKENISEYYRHRHLLKVYGITLAQLHGILAAQEYRCAICRSEIDEFTRAIDHDHSTNKIRGLLCRNCNSAIGFLGENPKTCSAASDYLTRANAESLRKTELGK